MHFNPRIPYGMRRWTAAASACRSEFQSTHPVWDATDAMREELLKSFISIHASRMGCDMTMAEIMPYFNISIHASRMGCDYLRYPARLIPRHFNPRIPYGMRLFVGGVDAKHDTISIHASRMGCDSNILDMSKLPALFQSTHPVWDATCRSSGF